MKKIIYIVVGIALLVAITGIIKFNFINDDVYVPDGKGGYVNEYGETAEFEFQDGKINDNTLDGSAYSDTEAKIQNKTQTKVIAQSRNKPKKQTSTQIEEEINTSNTKDNDDWIQILEDEYDVFVTKSKDGYIMSEEVDFAEDCLAGEKFNKEEYTCEIFCGGEQSCFAKQEEIDDFLEKEFEEWGNAQEEFAQDFTELELDTDEIGDSLQVEYEVKPTEQFIVTKGAENQMHKRIKNWLAIISPDNLSNTFLKKLIIYSDPNTDGLAYVEEDRGRRNNWGMYVNIGALKQEGDDKEVVFTLVHEFAHILTLNSSQLDIAFLENDDAECTGYLVPEGCLTSRSYLSRFYHGFWEGKFDPMANSELENYDKNPSAFVDEYAATNPGEDIAETFASFVFQKKPAIANTIAKQKILFFYQYPELVEIRENIRSQLKQFVRKRM